MLGFLGIILFLCNEADLVLFSYVALALARRIKKGGTAVTLTKNFCHASFKWILAVKLSGIHSLVIT